MKKPKAQRPIDVKDAPWSHIGKDALDAAAERLWNTLDSEHLWLACAFDGHAGPYHLASSASQGIVQRAVLDQLGTTVPAMLRQRAKEIRRNGASADECTALLDLADELESDHG